MIGLALNLRMPTDAGFAVGSPGLRMMCAQATK